MILRPPAASHCNPSFPRRRSSSSPLSSRRQSAATCLPFRPFSTSSCANGSTRARSDGQSSSCFLREAPRLRRAPILPTRRRSSSIWCALLTPFISPFPRLISIAASVCAWLSGNAPVVHLQLKMITDFWLGSTSTLPIPFLLPSLIRNTSVINLVSRN